MSFYRPDSCSWNWMIAGMIWLLSIYTTPTVFDDEIHDIEYDDEDEDGDDDNHDDDDNIDDDDD